MRSFLIKMAAKAKKISAEKKELEDLKAGIYKGYDIRWLENQPDHPDHALAAEGRRAQKKLK